MMNDTTNRANKKLGKPKRYRTCDECCGSGKIAVYWDNDDELR